MKIMSTHIGRGTDFNILGMGSQRRRRKGEIRHGILMSQRKDMLKAEVLVDS
jgi:hypothetical protein